MKLQTATDPFSLSISLSLDYSAPVRAVTVAAAVAADGSSTRDILLLFRYQIEGARSPAR
jgi:hypothetical protein